MTPATVLPPCSALMPVLAALNQTKASHTQKRAAIGMKSQPEKFFHHLLQSDWAGGKPEAKAAIGAKGIRKKKTKRRSRNRSERTRSLTPPTAVNWART